MYYIDSKGKNRKLHAVVFDAGPGVLMLNMSGGGFFIPGTRANFGTGQILDHAQFPYPWSKICPVLKFGLVLKIKNHPIYVPRFFKSAVVAMHMACCELAPLPQLQLQ